MGLSADDVLGWERSGGQQVIEPVATPVSEVLSTALAEGAAGFLACLADQGGSLGLLGGTRESCAAVPSSLLCRCRDTSDRDRRMHGERSYASSGSRTGSQTYQTHSDRFSEKKPLMIAREEKFSHNTSACVWTTDVSGSMRAPDRPGAANRPDGWEYRGRGAAGREARRREERCQRGKSLHCASGTPQRRRESGMGQEKDGLGGSYTPRRWRLPVRHVGHPGRAAGCGG